MPADSGHDDMPYLPGNHEPAQPPDTASAAHKIIDMLTVVIGSLEQLRRQPLDERGQQQLGRAEHGAEQAARFAQQLLAPAGSTGRDAGAS